MNLLRISFNYSSKQMGKHTILILWGNSPKNKNWIEKMNKYLQSSYPTIEFFYSHWTQNVQDINFEEEIKRLSKFIKDNNLTNYSIVAKSAGFVLSLQGSSNNILNPRTIVWYGLPTEYSTYRNINLQALIHTASQKTNIICIQASEDPQWNLKVTEDIIANTIPIWGIEDNTHNYDTFKEMVDIAKAFIAIHAPQIEYRIENINAKSLSDSIKIIDKSPKKYRFHNNWLFDFKKKIYIFSYKNKKIILKKGNINNLNKEIDSASKISQLTNKIKIENKELVSIVPKLHKINSRRGYLVSEYAWSDCNELFYQHMNNIISIDELICIITKLHKLSIFYKGFLPRNVIIKSNKIYLIDQENIIFNQISTSDIFQYKTSILIAWRYLTTITEDKLEEVFLWIDIKKKVEYLNKYEKTFKNMLGLTEMDNSQIQKLCYKNIINATNYENQFSFIKLDDILHSISGILSVEIELFIDFLLNEEHDTWSLYLYSNLSNIIKIARMKSFMNINTKQIKKFIINQIKKLVLEKLKNQYSKLWVRKSIIKSIQNKNSEYKPLDNYLIEVEKFLLN